MKLFDTAQNTYVPFRPDKLVTMYICGITPYDSAHLGHIFTFMTYDLLQRRLEDTGHEVRMVRNITDVDEPIYQRAAELNIDYTTLAAREIKSFQATLSQLHFRPLFAEPKASEYIDEMARAVKQLCDDGFAYKLEEDIYFDISKYSKFGKFSGFNRRLLLNFARDRGGDPERPGKRSPLDFLLWRGITDPKDPAQWQTVLGNGRPGWHIECTVMSTALLGSSFNLHGGGTDLIYPHHECEIAQSFGLGQPQPAKCWLHVSPLLFLGEKMSKSLGNLVFAKDLLADHSPAVIRLALMHYHHRIGGQWQPELLHEAERIMAKLHACAKVASKSSAEKLLAEVRAALDDDLNTIEIINALYRFIAAQRESKGHSKEVSAPVNQALELLGLS